jgi:hypothetical protein
LRSPGTYGDIWGGEMEEKIKNSFRVKIEVQMKRTAASSRRRINWASLSSAAGNLNLDGSQQVGPIRISLSKIEFRGPRFWNSAGKGCGFSRSTKFDLYIPFTNLEKASFSRG